MESDAEGGIAYCREYCGSVWYRPIPKQPGKGYPPGILTDSNTEGRSGKSPGVHGKRRSSTEPGVSSSALE